MPKVDENPPEGPEESRNSEATETSESSGDGVTRGSGTETAAAAGKIAKNPKSTMSQMATDTATKIIPGGEETQAKVKEVAETVRRVKRSVESAKNTISTMSSALSSIVGTLFNPIFWIVVAAVLAVVLIITSIVASTHVLGKNENAEGCIPSGTGGGTGVKAEASADKIATGNSIAGWLMTTKFAFLGDKPMSVNQVAGIIGNWDQESGLKPAIVQGNSVSPDASNAEIKALSGGGMAVGLAQWDGGRRTKLVEFAESKGGIWSDINIQLEFFKSELDGFEGSNLVVGGFNDQSKTPEELTLIFMEKFERAGIPHMENRYAAAKEFLANYNGGYSSAPGGSCLTAKGDVNTSDAVQLAISLSYETSGESYVTGGDSYGKTKAKPEYIEAKAKAEAVGGVDGLTGLYASCDRFVATVVKLTSDPSIPWGSTSEQQAYLSSSPKWQQYTKKSEAQPGDIWVTRSNGHIIFYVGDYKGQDTIAHASYLDRVAALDYASYLDENLIDQGGRAYYGYRFIG